MKSYEQMPSVEKEDSRPVLDFFFLLLGENNVTNSKGETAEIISPDISIFQNYFFTMA